MLHAFARFSDGRVSCDSSRQALAQAVNDPHALLWLDMLRPTEEELSLLVDVFHLDAQAIDYSRSFSKRPRVHSYVSHPETAGYYYLVMHSPYLETPARHRHLHATGHQRPKEIDFFISPRWLLTIHDEPLRAISETLTLAQADTAGALAAGTDALLYGLLDRLVDNYERIIDHLDPVLDRLEEAVIDRPTPHVLQQIAQLKRSLLNLRRFMAPEREVIAQLTRGEIPFLSDSVRIGLRDVHDHMVRHVESVELYRDLVMNARDIYLSSISNRLNQIMKTLTMFSVIALPLTVITGFFGMNFEAIPGIHSRQAFWVTVAVMAAGVTMLLTLFYRRGWIGPGSTPPARPDHPIDR